MSAFTVSDYHINYLVSFGAFHDARIVIDGQWQNVRGNEQAAVELLIDGNYRSVNYRYKAKDKTPKIVYRMMTGHDAVQVLKACDCFDYQACELPNYENTDVAKLIESIRSAATRALPGYDAAAWDLHTPKAVRS